MKISIVIPLKRNTHSTNDEVDRFCAIGLPSLLKYLSLDEIDRLIVITPMNESLSVETQIRSVIADTGPWAGKLKLRMLYDHHLCSLSTSGWLFQQLLKLEAARFTTAPYYLVLDSDIYLTRPLQPSRDLIDTEGRLLMTTDPLSYHPEWYGPSCDVLKTTMDALFKEGSSQSRVMQVTPQILVTEEVKGLLAWLSASYGEGTYQEYLLRHGFTEFSLYWCWLVLNKKQGQLYQTASGGNLGKIAPGSMIDLELDQPRLMGNALWFAPQPPHTLASWVERQFRNNQKYFFSLIQSNISGLSLETVISVLRPRVAPFPPEV